MKEKERSLFNFLIKPSLIEFVLRNKLSDLSDKISLKDTKITIMDLACGNGSNSRAIVSGLHELYPDLKFKIVLVDISSVLLEEALKRYSNFLTKQDIVCEVEAVQLNLTDREETIEFLNDFRGIFDLVFSIKFLHNTNVKIDNHISKVISGLLKRGGVFVTQYYNVLKIIEKLKLTLMFLMKRKYGNSVAIDRFFANRNLRKNGLKLVYFSKCKTTDFSVISMNHFYNNQIENYYLKI